MTALGSRHRAICTNQSLRLYRKQYFGAGVACRGSCGTLWRPREKEQTRKKVCEHTLRFLDVIFSRKIDKTHSLRIQTLNDMTTGGGIAPLSLEERAHSVVDNSEAGRHLAQSGYHR